MDGTDAEIAVPAGKTEHDLWTNQNTVPRLMQAIDDTDFQAEVKFESAPTGNSSYDGILVQQDSSNFLRFDFLSTGTNQYRVFAASIINGKATTIFNKAMTGTAPGYMRVQRVGNRWTQYYSQDGATWTTGASFTQALTVAGIGPYAGNSTNNPAFTAKVDYFFNTDSPIVPEDGPADVTAPTISGIAVTPGTNQLQVNFQTDEAARGSIKYGLTNQYELGTVSETTSGTSHSLLLQNLQPGKTYYLSVQAADPSGNVGTASTTGATIAIQALRSDDFHSSTLNPMWTFVNPSGDCTLTMDGTDAEIAVPSGKGEHDLWTNQNTVPRLMQTIDNTDFQAEVKFESTPTGNSSYDGILVQQDNDNLLRFDFLSTGTNQYRVFAASIINGKATTVFSKAFTGTAPGYMRVQRVGNRWTQYYSQDGATWTTGASFTQALTVSAIGPYAGNSTNNPAFTAKVDYFFNTDSPIVPEDGPTDVTPPAISGIAVTPTTNQLQVNFQTDEAARGSIKYGLTNQYELGTVSETTSGTSHSLLLQNLQPGKTYYLYVQAADPSGNVGSATATGATTPIAAVTSDDFHAATLKPMWTFVNPRGDCSYQFNGQDLLLSIPAGSSHDIWTGENASPRMLQSISDADFQAEVKFESQPNARYQMQGIMVQQDANNLLRFDFVSPGSGKLNIFAGDMQNGVAATKYIKAVDSAPVMYMRVTRQGSHWTESYSYDGSTWITAASFDQAMTVSQVGPFAGNTGDTNASSPAWTAAVDYFFNTNSPIVPEDGPTDVTPPAISGIAVTPTTNQLQVNFQTDEFARGSVKYGLTNQYELGTVSETTAGTSHSLLLQNLQPGTTYYLNVQAADLSGNIGGVSTTGATNGIAAVTSDDFHTATLKPMWTFVNPKGDCSYLLNGQDLLLNIPAGSSHDTWTGENASPRLLQTISDADFQVEAKFESQPNARYQMQGIMAQQDADNLLRFDFFSTGSGQLSISAADMQNGVAASKHLATIDTAPVMYMRVTRQGSHWTESYSYDGSTWITAASFDQAMTVSQVGPFAGNTGDTAAASPAWTAAVDYFFNTASPISPEDGGVVPPDTTPPQIQNVSASPSATAIEIKFATDEPATTSIRYGLTSNYELGTVSESGTPATSHDLTISSLAQSTGYHYCIVATDTSGNTTTSADMLTTTTGADSRATSVNMWYGDTEHFGGLGSPQRQVNLLGNASDLDGLKSATFSVNGGAAQTLGLGPDTLRLQNPGDFNVEIDTTTLHDGDNTVLLSFTDALNNVVTHTVHVIYSSTPTLSMPYTIDWSQVSDISQVAQIVDGDWKIDNGTLRPAQTGYDRMVAIGNMNWHDYEVTVPVTLHSYDPAGFSPTAGVPGLGIVMGWQGYYAWDGRQPSWGWQPLGAIASYEWTPDKSATRLVFDENPGMVASTYLGMDFDVTYMWKMRAQTQGDGSVLYSAKIWQQGTDEPSNWTLTAYDRSNSLKTGSIGLIAHNTDVSFGNVTVTPLS